MGRTAPWTPLRGLATSSACAARQKIRGQDKIFKDADAAVADVQSGSTLLAAGFGWSGEPSTLIEALARRKDLKDLVGVSNNAGALRGGGLDPLIQSGQLTSVVMSFIGGNKGLEKKYLEGSIKVELCPQGTLAERIRAGGAGIPGFYTPTGVNTAVQFGQIPARYGPKDAQGNLTVAEYSEKRETKEFDGKVYNLEKAIKGDVALIRAWKADKVGNVQFRGSTKTFGIPMAKAAAVTIVEAEEIVEAGSIQPENVHIPSIYVDRICPATTEKRIEILKTIDDKDVPAESDESPAAIRRKRIAKRAAKEFTNGAYVNLGVGMPTLAPSYMDPSIKVWLQSENGILGMGDYPTKEAADADLINAGKETVTLLPGASTFESPESFAMIRGGHIDISMLGALEVDAAGNLANYMIPGKKVNGMGGAMDLVANPEGTRIVVLTDHTDKNGKAKILEKCTLPLTGAQVVSRIITELAVFDVDLKKGGLTLREHAPGVSVEEIKSKTGAQFAVAEDLKSME